MSILLAEANKMVEAALAKAREMNIIISVAVVDAGGNLIALQRMDGAAPSTSMVCQGKARSSAMFGRTSEEVAKRTESAPTRTILDRQGELFVPWQGAVPIWRDGILEGACGASGAASEDDETCARAGVVAAGLKG